MTQINPLHSSGNGVAPQEARLRKVVAQLEGVFVEQLFKAMRETVPHDGIADGGAGEEMFTGMLDQHLSGAAPAQWQHGIGESLYRQLRPALSSDSTTVDSPTATTGIDEMTARTRLMAPKAPGGGDR